MTKNNSNEFSKYQYDLIFVKNHCTFTSLLNNYIIQPASCPEKRVLFYYMMFSLIIFHDLK